MSVLSVLVVYGLYGYKRSNGHNGWESINRHNGWDSITSFNPSTSLCPLLSAHGFQMSYV